MIAKVHPSTSVKGGNKGSSFDLGHYLDKENNGKESSDREEFFSHSKGDIKVGEAIEMIDRNNKNLGKNDAKFFMISLNPSHREQAHLASQVSGRKISDPSELSPVETKLFMQKLKDFTNDSMGEYARNFNRENVKSEKDLVYFAKVETCRKYKFDDKDVEHNVKIQAKIANLRPGRDSSPEEKKEAGKKIIELEKSFVRNGSGKPVEKGMLKDGFNFHVHVVVSRNNDKQNTKLSPQSRSRGGKQTLNGKQVEQGFNHETFKQKVGNVFNSKFSYKPLQNETYQSKKQEFAKKKSGAKGTQNSEAKGLTNVTRNIKGKVKGIINEHLTSGQLSTERRMITGTIQAVKNVVLLVSSPSHGLISIAKQIAAKIISAGNSK